ncbi:MAG: hypothetical protein ACRETN_05270 [Nevskiales bacterium]
MIQGLRHALACTTATVLLLSTTGCGPHLARIQARGAVTEHALDTAVDSSHARYYLESYLAGQRARPELDHEFDQLGNDHAAALPTTEQLQAISARHSPDTAALVLARALLSQPENQRWQQRFESELALVKQTVEGRESPYLKTLPYRVVFVPGWLYESKPWTGADFASTRRLLQQFGLQPVLLPVGENDTVEVNAAKLVAGLRPYLATGRPIILVSGSKGGPETAFALSELFKPEETRLIKAWINICGALKGSPIADDYLHWTRRWFATFIFRLNGYGDLTGLESMRYAIGQKRAAPLKIPQNVLVVNYLGVPMSGDIRVFTHQFTYHALRRYGPNDGLALVRDEIASEGPTVTEVGRAHFLSDPDIHIRNTAMIQAVARRLAGS